MVRTIEGSSPSSALRSLETAVVERALHDADAGPDGFQQFVLGDHLAGVEQQLVKHLQGLRFQLDRLAVEPQHAAGFIELALGEAPEAARNVP